MVTELQVAIPLALVWGLLFSLLTVLYVWLLRPVLRVLEMVLAVIRKVMIGRRKRLRSNIKSKNVKICTVTYKNAHFYFIYLLAETLN